MTSKKTDHEQTEKALNNGCYFYEKIITINDTSDIDVLVKSVLNLIDFMIINSPKYEYFRLYFTDSEKSPFAKDLILKWCVLK